MQCSFCSVGRCPGQHCVLLASFMLLDFHDGSATFLRGYPPPTPFLRVAKGARSGLALQILCPFHFVEEAAGPQAWPRVVVLAQNTGSMDAPLTWDWAHPVPL